MKKNLDYQKVAKLMDELLGVDYNLLKMSVAVWENLKSYNFKI